MVKKCSKIDAEIWPSFLSEFLLIFDGFGVPKSMKNQLNIHLQRQCNHTLNSSCRYSKNKKNKCFFIVFAISAMLSCSQVASKINKKSMTNLCKIQSLFKSIFWLIFHWFWRPRYLQNPSKIHDKSVLTPIKKMIDFFNVFFFDFGRF